jgi:hypothetical protein
VADSGTRGPTCHTPEGERSLVARSPDDDVYDRPRPPAYSPPSREPNGACGMAKGAREASCRCAWRSGDVGGRRWSVPGHGMVNGGAREQPRRNAVLVRAKRGQEVERRGGVHEAELSGELSRAPASNSHQREPYHGLSR